MSSTREYLFSLFSDLTEQNLDKDYPNQETFSEADISNIDKRLQLMKSEGLSWDETGQVIAAQTPKPAKKKPRRSQNTDNQTSSSETETSERIHTIDYLHQQIHQKAGLELSWSQITKVLAGAGMADNLKFSLVEIQILITTAKQLFDQEFDPITQVAKQVRGSISDHEQNLAEITRDVGKVRAKKYPQMINRILCQTTTEEMANQRDDIQFGYMQLKEIILNEVEGELEPNYLNPNQPTTKTKYLNSSNPPSEVLETKIEPDSQ
jgi:hypothetical protein